MNLRDGETIDQRKEERQERGTGSGPALPGMGSRREAMNQFWKWMPIAAAAAITLLVLWFITMDFLTLYLLFGK